MQNKRAIITGIFVLIGVVILVVTIFTLGGQHDTFVKKITVKAVFDDINGLKSGNNIWFSGVKIGTVKAIDLRGNSVVEVTLNIDKQAIGFIHKDSRIKISSDGFIGNKIVVIYGGTAASPLIEKDDYLATEKMPGTDDMMATLQENNKNLLEITNNFKVISKNIADGKGSLGALINDKTLFVKLEHTIGDLQTTLGNFKTTSAGSKAFMANLVAFSGDLNRESSSIHRLVTDTALYATLNNGVNHLQQASKAAADFADTLRAAGSKLNQTDNTIGVLLNDKATADSFKAIIKNLATSSKKLDEDLEAAQHNFLLRGFFRKREKEKAKQ
jgi:phospholipid/cholesterol/gamma-HCH transport system substrate-binding protein